MDDNGNARGSKVWAPDKGDSDEGLLVRARGGLECGIDETVVGSRLVGTGGGGISFVSEISTSAGTVLDYRECEPEDIYFHLTLI